MEKTGVKTRWGVWENPLKCFQKGQLALKESCWTVSQPHKSAQKLKRGECVGSLRQDSASFSHALPLSYTLVQELPPPKAPPRIFRELLYVSLQHVEEWVAPKGVYQLKEEKDSKHFSKYFFLRFKRNDRACGGKGGYVLLL